MARSAPIKSTRSIEIRAPGHDPQSETEFRVDSDRLQRMSPRHPQGAFQALREGFSHRERGLCCEVCAENATVQRALGWVGGSHGNATSSALSRTPPQAPPDSLRA